MRRLFPISFLIGLCGCQASSAGDSELTDNSWPNLLDTFTRSPDAVYAPSFSGPPPAGKFLRLSLHASSAEAACGLYQNDFGGEGDQVFARVTTSEYSTGRFEIVENLTDEATKQAQVRIIRSHEGVKAASYFAMSGYVEITTLAQDLSQWQNGVRLTGHVHASFSSDPLAQSVCSGGVSKDGTKTPTRCECLYSSGKTSSCEPTAQTIDSCCSSPGAAVLDYDADFSAEPCAFVCAYTDPSLAGYCLELQ